MLKLRSTLHEVAWQFNNLAYSSGLMLAASFLELILDNYSVRIGHQREQNCIEKGFFKSQFYILRNT